MEHIVSMIISSRNSLITLHPGDHPLYSPFLYLSSSSTYYHESLFSFNLMDRIPLSWVVVGHFISPLRWLPPIMIFYPSWGQAMWRACHGSSCVFSISLFAHILQLLLEASVAPSWTLTGGLSLAPPFYVCYGCVGSDQMQPLQPLVLRGVKYCRWCGLAYQGKLKRRCYWWTRFFVFLGMPPACRLMLGFMHGK